MEPILTVTDPPSPEARRMLALAEDEARQRGCATVVLYTLSFQAPGFYERQGDRVFGTIPCRPAGSSRVFLAKSI